VVVGLDAFSDCFGLASDEFDSKPFALFGGVMATDVVPLSRRTFEGDSDGGIRYEGVYWENVFDQSFFLKWRVRCGVEVTVLKNGALKS